MVQGEMPIIHVRRPIGQNVRQFSGSAHGESKIDIRPPVLASGGRGASDRRAANARVAAGIFQEAGAQAIAFFRSEHAVSIIRREGSP